MESGISLPSAAKLLGMCIVLTAMVAAVFFARSLRNFLRTFEKDYHDVMAIVNKRGLYLECSIAWLCFIATLFLLFYNLFGPNGPQ